MHSQAPTNIAVYAQNQNMQTFLSSPNTKLDYNRKEYAENITIDLPEKIA
jgi:hypothetical protein